jgi:serine/threonine protein kinase
MEARLRSIDAFLAQCDDIQLVPGARLFSVIPMHYQNWCLRHDDIEEIRQVGIGASAQVFYGRDRRTGNEIAVKKLNGQALHGGGLQLFQREVSILATAKHPCLVEFVGATDSFPFCIVTRWMPNGSLYRALAEGCRFEPTQRTKIAFDIARAMQFLHSLHIIHRDLKTLNVLLDADGRARVCDFGLSRLAEADGPMTCGMGTKQWMAPELFDLNSYYTNKVDVYAYGIVLWELVTGKLPYLGIEDAQIRIQVAENDLRPCVPRDCPNKLRRLIERCWARDPNSRPTFDEIIGEFRDGVALLGSDEDDVASYIREAIGDAAPAQDEMSREELETLVESGDVVSDVGKFAEALRRTHDSSLIVKGLRLVIGNCQHESVSGLLRKLPVGSIPKEMSVSIAQQIPTGRSDVDIDLAVAACKNAAHDWVGVLAFDDFFKKLAFVVGAIRGVDEGLKGAIADRCVQCLNSTDDRLVIATFNCLARIGQLGRVTLPVAQALLRADRSEPLMNCVCVAVINWARLSNPLPLEDVAEMAAVLMDRINSGLALAVPALLSLCQNGNTVALHVLNKLPKWKNMVWEEFYVKLLMVMQVRNFAPGLLIRDFWSGDGIDRSRFASADRAMKEAFRRADAAGPQGI